MAAKIDRNLPTSLFFTIPNARRDSSKKQLAATWLSNISINETPETFNFGYHKRVCEDHFTARMFTKDTSMWGTLGKTANYQKQLIKGAVPTIFAPQCATGKGLESQHKRVRRMHW